MHRAVSKFVHAEDLVIPYGATDLLTAPRITHIIRMDKNEVLKLQLTGFYKEVDLPSGSITTENNTSVQEAIDDAQGVQLSGSGSEELILHEVHSSLDLIGFEHLDVEGEETVLKIPYVITILEKTGEILSIRRNHDEMHPLMRRTPYFVHY